MTLRVADVFHVRHAYAWPALDYRKRPHVFQLVLSLGTAFLFQAEYGWQR